MQQAGPSDPTRDRPLHRTTRTALAGVSPRRAARERRLWHTAIAIVAAAGAVRLLMAAASPLVPDEAYYWEWSRRLAIGYFDHPPVIAVLVAAGTSIFGATPFGVRVVPVLAGILTMLLVVDLARRHGGGMAAVAAALIASCVPLAAAGLVLAAPDTPLLLAYAAGLWAVDRALAAGPGSRDSFGWWVAAGAALGLGMASKYTAVLLPLGVLVAFAVRPTLRRWLRAPEPYVACVVALVLFLPVVIWNARHEWASFAFQLQHGLSPAGGSPFGRVLDLLGNQVGLVSPILFVLLALATAGSLTRDADDRRFVLAVVAAATFGFFVYTAMRQRPEPNWPAPAYLPAFVLLSLVAARPVWRRWVRAGAVLGALMVALVYVQVLHPVLPVPPRKDPMARGHGWDVLARSALAAAPAREAGDGAVWFGANRYQDAAQLAFHLPGNPIAFSLNLENRTNQYDFWPGFADRAQPGDALVLTLDDTDGAFDIVGLLRPHFADARRGEAVELRRGGGVVTTRRMWVLEGWRGSWPQ